MRAADPAATAAMAEALFTELLAAGARHCIVSPGSRSAPLAVAALRCEPLGLRVYPHADERSAGFFSLGLAKASSTPVLLVCTSGTAAANYLPAIVEAHYAGVPLIAITGDRPPELREWDAGQTIDQVRLFGSHVRWFHELPLPESGADAERLARALARRAVATALGPRPGPVHLNWPLREPLTPLRESPRVAAPARAPVRAANNSIAPTGAEIAALAALARREERGLVVAGPLPVESDLARPVTRFADAAGWPVIADVASQLRCGPHVAHAPIVAAAELLLRDGPFARANAPRAVVRLGSTPISKALRLWLDASKPAAYWLLDPHGQWSDPDQLATERSAADPAALLDAAADALGAPRRESAWRRVFTRAEHAAQAALTRAIDAEAALLEPRAARELAALLPDSSLLTLSNSMPVRDADAFWSASPQQLRVLVNRGANGIDGVTSTALGASAAWPGPVVLLTGDLAFLHDLGGLTAARHGGSLTIVLLQNDGGGIFSFLPIAEHGDAIGFERLFRAPHGLALHHAGALFGVPWQRVTSWEHFRATVKAGLASPGVSVVELPVDRDENVRCFRALARVALDAAAESAA